jgi:hypothetical protein
VWLILLALPVGYIGGALFACICGYMGAGSIPFTASAAVMALYGLHRLPYRNPLIQCVLACLAGLVAFWHVMNLVHVLFAGHGAPLSLPNQSTREVWGAGCAGSAPRR